MTDITAPIHGDTPAGTPKNTQARATVQILSTVRAVGTVVYALAVGLILLGTLIGTFTSDQHLTVFFGGIMAAAILGVFGALFYATIGWLVETLSMLTQIARNTAR